MTHYLSLTEAALLVGLKTTTLLTWGERDGLLHLHVHVAGEIFVDRDELVPVAVFRLAELRKGNRFWKDEWKVLHRLREQ